MSDTLTNKIMIDNPDDLPGGQQPLSADVANGRVRGTDADQNSLANCIRGAEVPASSQTSERGYSVTGVEVSVKPVDRKTLEGSYAGDSRAKGAPAVLPNNPGVREPMGQVANGKFCK